MDWNGIVFALLSTTTLGGIFGTIAYRKENKRLKQLEVKNTNTEAQKKQIELGELYSEKMLALLERVESKQDSATGNQQKMLDKLDTLDERMDKVEVRVSDIVTYLNGNFQDFLKEQHRKPRAK